MTRVKETFDVWSSLRYYHYQQALVEYNNDKVLKAHHVSYTTLTHNSHTDKNPVFFCEFQTACIICDSVSTFKHWDTNIPADGPIRACIFRVLHCSIVFLDFYIMRYLPGILAPFFWCYARNRVRSSGEKILQIFHVNYTRVCSKKPFKSLDREPLSGMKLAVSWVLKENMSSGIWKNKLIPPEK